MVEIPLWLFGLLALVAYAPLAVFVGHEHKKRQLDTDAKISYKIIIERIDTLELSISELLNKNKWDSLEQTVSDLNEQKKSKKPL